MVSKTFFVLLCVSALVFAELAPEEVEVLQAISNDDNNISWTLEEIKSCQLGDQVLCITHEDQMHVKTIQLVSQALSRFPENLKLLKFLEQLDLSDNQISEIPEDSFEEMKALRHLILSKNTFTLTSKLFNGISDLLTLELVACGLTSIPSKSLNLISLTKLDLSGNDFSSGLLSNVFEDLLGVTELNLENSQLRGLSEEMFQYMFNLVTLNLNGNNFGDNLRDNAFDGLVSLETLSLKNAGITEIKTKPFLALNYVTTLDLSNNKLTTISNDALEGMIRLSDLHLENNLLTTLEQKALIHLNRLVNLYLQGNKITKMPNYFLARNVEIKFVDFSNNILFEIPLFSYFPIQSLTDFRDNCLSTCRVYEALDTIGDQPPCTNLTTNPLTRLNCKGGCNLEEEPISTKCFEAIFPSTSFDCTKDQCKLKDKLHLENPVYTITNIHIPSGSTITSMYQTQDGFIFVEGSYKLHLEGTSDFILKFDQFTKLQEFIDLFTSQDIYKAVIFSNNFSPENLKLSVELSNGEIVSTSGYKGENSYGIHINDTVVLSLSEFIDRFECKEDTSPCVPRIGAPAINNPIDLYYDVSFRDTDSIKTNVVGTDGLFRGRQKNVKLNNNPFVLNLDSPDLVASFCEKMPTDGMYTIFNNVHLTGSLKDITINVNGKEFKAQPTPNTGNKLQFKIPEELRSQCVLQKCSVETCTITSDSTLENSKLTVKNMLILKDASLTIKNSVVSLTHKTDAVPYLVSDHGTIDIQGDSKIELAVMNKESLDSFEKHGRVFLVATKNNGVVKGNFNKVEMTFVDDIMDGCKAYTAVMENPAADGLYISVTARNSCKKISAWMIGVIVAVAILVIAAVIGVVVFFKKRSKGHKYQKVES